MKCNNIFWDRGVFAFLLIFLSSFIFLLFKCAGVVSTFNKRLWSIQGIWLTQLWIFLVQIKGTKAQRKTLKVFTSLKSDTFATKSILFLLGHLFRRKIYTTNPFSKFSTKLCVIWFRFICFWYKNPYYNIFFLILNN